MNNESRISMFCCIFLIIKIGVFSYILVFHTSTLHQLLREDSWIEYLGFMFLILTSIFLFYTGYNFLKKEQPSKILGITFLLAGIIFFLAAGEEISWGQRIFSLETPEILKGINEQDELNIHNINKRLFQRGFRHITTLLIFISAISFFKGRDRLLGVKVPDTFLVFSFLLMPAYSSYKQIIPEYHLGYIVLIFYFIYFIRRGDLKMFIATISIILTIASVVIVHLNFNSLFQSNNTAEVREYFFSFSCFFYSVLLFRDSRQLRYSATEKPRL